TKVVERSTARPRRSAAALAALRSLGSGHATAPAAGQVPIRASQTADGTGRRLKPQQPADAQISVGHPRHALTSRTIPDVDARSSLSSPARRDRSSSGQPVTCAHSLNTGRYLAERCGLSLAATADYRTWDGPRTARRPPPP